MRRPQRPRAARQRQRRRGQGLSALCGDPTCLPYTCDLYACFWVWAASVGMTLCVLFLCAVSVYQQLHAFVRLLAGYFTDLPPPVRESSALVFFMLLIELLSFCALHFILIRLPIISA